MARLKLDSRKAIEAAAILTGRSPGRRIGSKRLLALLYAANRECLKRSGRPLLGGRLAAMKYGPINADVYDLIKQRQGAEGLAEWSRHFQNEHYYLVLDQDPGVHALSRFEVRLLDEALKKYEDADDWDVALQTHRFPEYGTTYQKGTTRTIPLEALLHAVGLTPMVGSILRDLEAKQAIDEMFARVKKPAGKKR